MSECEQPQQHPIDAFEKYVHQRFHDLANATQSVVNATHELTVSQERQTILMEQQAELLKRVMHDVSGNGKPGLKSDVSDLTRRLDAHDETARQRAEELKEKTESQKWWLRWIMGIVSTILTAGIIAFSTFAWTQYQQVRALIQNQETMSRQVQQLPGAKPSQPIVNP